MMSISVTGRNLGISANQPTNHRFQGLSGTRQMDGYHGPIMSLAIRDRGLSPIEILLSNISEKMFLLGEFIPSEYKDALKRYSSRFRFLAKYLHKYYANELKPNQKVSLPSPASAFASIVEASKQPLEMKSLLLDRKFGLTEKDIEHKFTIVDKILRVYTKIETQVSEVYNDLLKQCPYKASLSQNIYVIDNPAKRFWKILDGYSFSSPENMSYLVNKKIHNKDLDPIYLFLQRTLEYCIRREKLFLPSEKKLKQEYKKRTNLERSDLVYKERLVLLNWNLDQAWKSIKDSIEGKFYEDKMNQAFSETMKEVARFL